MFRKRWCQSRWRWKNDTDFALTPTLSHLERGLNAPNAPNAPFWRVRVHQKNIFFAALVFRVFRCIHVHRSATQWFWWLFGLISINIF